ncbi:MAG: hypothetical protein IJU35_05175 [Paludibacteraceae bacterium]|nr:hypothetical protein [Paludibacteraceae bacterium]
MHACLHPPSRVSGGTALTVGGTHGWHACLHPPSRVSGGTALTVGGTHGWYASLHPPSRVSGGTPLLRQDRETVNHRVTACRTSDLRRANPTSNAR